MKKFLTVALAGVLAASMLFTGCSKKEESKVPDKLIVGTNAEFPPFEYMNDKKQPDGFDIAMIKEIGKRMDKKVEIQNMEFKSLIGAMESNSINTIIAGMTKTKERQKSVDFSDSYYTSNQAIILKKDSKIKKLSQLEGKKVGVQEGTTGDIIASGEKFGEKNKVIVQCKSKDTGAKTRKVCSNGCIGCKKCEKTCKFDAIHVIDGVAKIDYDKCKNCKMCAKACPKGCIEPVPTEEEKAKFKEMQAKQAAAAKAKAEAAKAAAAEKATEEQ